MASLKSIAGFLFDLDGVMYVGSSGIQPAMVIDSIADLMTL
ncbi:MAG: hypothetical protein U9R56_02785 [candidate division Zixibacteria bacterium]|nr:hypothetical protein [candidate division Zixibacteria bacterium]